MDGIRAGLFGFISAPAADSRLVMLVAQSEEGGVCSERRLHVIEPLKFDIARISDSVNFDAWDVSSHLFLL